NCWGSGNQASSGRSESGGSEVRRRFVDFCVIARTLHEGCSARAQAHRRRCGFAPNLLFSVSWITFSINVIPITFFSFPVQVKSDSSVTRPTTHPRRGGPSGLDPLPEPAEAGGDRGFVDARIRQPDIGPVLARLR